MNKKIESNLTQFAQSRQKAAGKWEKMPSQQRRNVEKEWDTEHAYYSATLEGNGLDRKRFEEEAKKIK